MTWIVGDVHGMHFTLQKLLEKIHSLDDNPNFVFVGDYVDRGYRTSQLLDCLIDLQQSGAIFIRGNHDDVVDWFLNGHALGDLSELTTDIHPNHAVAWWLYNGFAPTLLSYGVGPEESGEKIIDNLRNSVPQKHKDFLEGLPLYWENNTHFVCHGFMYPDKPLPRDLRFMPSDPITNTEILWNRFDADPAGGIKPSIQPTWDKIGVFGHTCVGEYQMVTAIKHGQIRLIDTGAFMKESLTGYNCHRDDFVSVAYDSRDLQIA